MEARTHSKKQGVIPKSLMSRNFIDNDIMSQFSRVQIIGTEVIISRTHPIEKADAIRRIKNGENVWGTRKNAKTLAAALSDGQGNMQHKEHVNRGYKHFHDINHKYKGHIFYGEPS